MRTTRILAVLCLSVIGAAAASAQADSPLPVIDVHVHAMPVADMGPPGQKFCTPIESFDPFDPSAGRSWPEEFVARSRNPACKQWVPAAATDEALMTETLEIFERRNIIGVVGGDIETVQRWKAAAPERVIASQRYYLPGSADVTPDVLGKRFDEGLFEVIGEVGAQYAGLAANAEELEPFWALAEDKDIPVGIHTGTMPPGAASLYGGRPRIALGDPFLLEDVLVRHPKLRVYMMHAGYPHVERTIAMLRQYPQLYVDIGVLPVTMPREEFHRFLERLVSAGQGKRIMFGSDQMIWPGIIEAAIEAVEAADLTQDQKRDIFYNNAARFLRLTEDAIAAHHANAP